MTDLVVLVPSRGRPDKVMELMAAFDATCRAYTELLIVVDDDDDSDYAAASSGCANLMVVRRPDPRRRGMVHALNTAAGRVVNTREDVPFAVGFMGDDHRPRDIGWDAAYLTELSDLGTGIVYGDDLLQGKRLPTQVAMTTDIVRTLGFMAPPVLRHLYVDNFWRDLGRGAGCLRYLEDVVVEHVHPAAGKAQDDAGYRAVNSSLMWALDRGAYDGFVRSGGLAAAVDLVAGLRTDAEAVPS